VAGILHEFVQNTKILASQVNENFATVQNDMTELGSGINANLTNEITKAKSDLLTDIQNVSNSKASLDLANINANGKANVIDWMAPNYGAGYSVSPDWTATKAGWIYCTIYSDASSTTEVQIDGKSVSLNYQWAGDGRAGGLRIGDTVFIRKGKKFTVKTTGNPSYSFVFYPCVGN
jgi:hypothetical protein